MNIKGPGSILLAQEHIFGTCLSRQQHTHRSVGPLSAAAWPLSLQLTQCMASRSLICCSLASLSSADSEASRSRWRVLICCSLASLSLQLIRWPVGPSSVVAWPLSLHLTRWPVGPSSVVAWPLSLQLTRWPVGHVFAAEVIAFVRQSEHAARLAQSLILRLLSRSSRCTAVSESRRSLSRSRLR